DPPPARRPAAGRAAGCTRARHGPAPARSVVDRAGARPHHPVRAGAARRPRCAPGEHRRASVLRPAQLARGAAVPPAARSRPRRPAAEGRGRAGSRPLRLMRVAIGLRLESNENWEEAATYVVEAERLGVDCVWSHESWGFDAATPLAFVAARTSRIRLGSGIMQAGTRTPALLTMTALSLAGMSGGRFLLGL